MNQMNTLPLEIENIIMDYKEQLEIEDQYYHIYYGTDIYLYRVVKGSEKYFKSGKNKGQLKEFVIRECLDNGEFSLITNSVSVKKTSSRFMGRRQGFGSNGKLTVNKGYRKNYLDPNF